ncbi:hypothetical protein ACQKLP_21195 [Chitinophaga sp. NPDC101104]|uniref:hypothetical protein n=1 Tax=Chitinophaga sp. NPDC101104 TaxID=3390561 RepID=UPI003D0081C5
MKYFPVCLLLLFSCMACGRRNGSPDVRSLEKRYSANPADSLKLEALHYLLREMPGQWSDQPAIIDASSGKPTHYPIDSFHNVESLLSFLQDRQLEAGGIPEKDAAFIRPEFLESEIDAAVAEWKRYPWNQDIPKEVFLDYLLPYKVHQDFPDNWRASLRQKADSLVKAWEEKNRKSPGDKFLTSSKEFYYDLIVNTASRWFRYGPDRIRITEDPSYKELLLTGEGGCKKGSFFNAYALRSTGIPATVDIVPFWGSKNGSHAGDVYWNNEERKMTPGPGRRFDRAAKVFRLTFRNHGSWSRQIKPHVQEKDFLLDFLRNDQWVDVTKEHNPVGDVTLPIGNTSAGIAYICVFDYGEWVPVYWAPVRNGQVTFPDMGRDIVYRLATFTDALQFSGGIFVLDSAGRTVQPRPDPQAIQTMVLGKLNTGSEQWVRKQGKYTLLALGEDNNWHEVAEKSCSRDSVIEFRNVPSGGLYRLVETGGPRRLERIFAYRNNTQVWY